MSSPTKSRKRTIDDVFAELDDIKKQILSLNENFSCLHNKLSTNVIPAIPAHNKKSRSLLPSSKVTKDLFEPSDERVLQLLMMAVLYSANQIGVTGVSTNNNEEPDFRHALGMVIPRSCCLFFQNTNQHVAQQKEKVEIVIYIYDKESTIEIPVVNFITNVRILHIKSVVGKIFEQNNSYASTVHILIVRSEIPDIIELRNHKNLVVVSLLDKGSSFSCSSSYDEEDVKIAYLPQMSQKLHRLIRYLAYYVSKNSQTNPTIILEEMQKVFQKVDGSQDFYNGVIALYSPLFACVFSSFLELKSQWKHLASMVYDFANNESNLTNQTPWSKIWKTNREFLSHLSLNEFLKTYDIKYQPGTNERSKFVSPNIVQALFCDHIDKHEARNFIFVPMSTITQLLKNNEFKQDLKTLLNEITPEIIQNAYTKFQHRKTFDFNKIPEKISNCLIDDSILPSLDDLDNNNDANHQSQTTKIKDGKESNEEEFTDWGGENGDDFVEEEEEFVQPQDNE